MGDEPHSAKHFGETRDHWWNPDFVQLLGRRLDLGSARRVLDVGCGVGHWERVLAPALHAEATVVGIDPEPRWIEEATARAAVSALAGRAEYRRASAEALPFDDGSFDLVTCQTVLMHLADPAAALRELWRVLEPGGLLLACEPNNRAGTLVFDSVDDDRSIDEVVAHVRGELVRQRGKRACGEGDDSFGDRLPGLVSELGPSDLQVYVNDRVLPVLPPHQDDWSRAFAAELRAHHGEGLHGWSADSVRRWFLAGGGTEAELERWWKLERDRTDSILAALDAGTYRGAGVGVGYVVGARKPS